MFLPQHLINDGPRTQKNWKSYDADCICIRHKSQAKVLWWYSEPLEIWQIHSLASSPHLSSMLLLPWGRNVNNFVAASKASGIDPGGNRGKGDWEGWMDRHSSPSSAILGLLIMIMKNVRHGSCLPQLQVTGIKTEQGVKTFQKLISKLRHLHRAALCTSTFEWRSWSRIIHLNSRSTKVAFAI